MADLRDHAVRLLKRCRTSVDDNDYQVPFAFTGKVDKVSVQLN
jgi:hypothetical protein